MAKKPVNPLEDLPTFKPEKESDKPKPKARSGYANPLDEMGLSASQVTKAVRQTSKAGNYKKRTFLITPEMDDVINKISKESGIRRMELGRWLLAKGIECYMKGEQPEVEQVVSVRVKMPEYSQKG